MSLLRELRPQVLEAEVAQLQLLELWRALR